jgi:formylglycine-generating enzyme required for sulfatase activity
MVYIERLNSLTEERRQGRVYRLPTEAEWEYACRAGSKTKYCFGDDAGQIDDYAWHAYNSGGRMHPVGQKKANGWGLYDMHGNVWEWCSDTYDDYPKGPVTDPVGPSEGSNVKRGGFWNERPVGCRSALRDWYDPSNRYYINCNDGFRLALSS